MISAENNVINIKHIGEDTHRGAHTHIRIQLCLQSCSVLSTTLLFPVFMLAFQPLRTPESAHTTEREQKRVVAQLERTPSVHHLKLFPSCLYQSYSHFIFTFTFIYSTFPQIKRLRFLLSNNGVCENHYDVLPPPTATLKQ